MIQVTERFVSMFKRQYQFYLTGAQVIAIIARATYEGMKATFMKHKIITEAAIVSRK